MSDVCVRFARVKSLVQFINNLEEKYSLYKNNTIVFIEDTKKIYCNGIYYGETDGIISNFIIETTYDELVNLRDNAELIPGLKYRITDYTCTTTLDATRSAGHNFDIIVTALSTNLLDSKASAILHDGDEYFSNSKLEAWLIWYDIDNDLKKYLWADPENGKGVICRMIDEFNNDCPYDFKNIQFKRYALADPDKLYLIFNPHTTINTYNSSVSHVISEGLKNHSNFKNREFNSDIHWVYTFDYEDINLYNSTVAIPGMYIYELGFTPTYNIIKAYKIPVIYDNVEYYTQALNDIVLLHISAYCINNYRFGIGCSNITLGDAGTNIIFGENCYNIIWGHSCDKITVGSNCSSILVSQILYNSNIGNDCHNIYIDYNNLLTIENNCNNIEMQYMCHNNELKANCSSILLCEGCNNNTFGNSCYNIICGSSCASNSFGNECLNNTFGYQCSANSLGNCCLNNTFDYNSSSNSLGNNCRSNELSYACCFNSFGNNCLDNSLGSDTCINAFGNGCRSNRLEYSCSGNTFGLDCMYNTLKLYSGCNIIESLCNSNIIGGEFNTLKSNCCHNNILGSYNLLNVSCHSITLSDGHKNIFINSNNIDFTWYYYEKNYFINNSHITLGVDACLNNCTLKNNLHLEIHTELLDNEIINVKGNSNASAYIDSSVSTEYGSIISKTSAGKIISWNSADLAAAIQVNNL